MKTKEELQDLKKECEDLARKLKELSEDELKEVAGGFDFNCNGYYFELDSDFRQ